MLLSGSRYRLTLGDDQLDISSVFYNTRIALSDIDGAEVRVVNMNEENFGITRRTNGIGLPGLQVGWFSGNGKKYKLYVSDRSKVLVIPTKNDYDILFSSVDADLIAQEIREKTNL
jgi:hypothetical protein